MLSSATTWPQTKKLWQNSNSQGLKTYISYKECLNKVFLNFRKMLSSATTWPRIKKICRFSNFHGSKTYRITIKSKKILTLWNGAPRNFTKNFSYPWVAEYRSCRPLIKKICRYSNSHGSKTYRVAIKSKKILTLWNGAPRNFTKKLS